MKKVLAIILCVLIALTLSVSVLAESSPENKVIIRKGVGTKQDGSGIPADTFVEVAEDSSVTVTANEKVYGKFNKWSIYVIKNVGGTEQTVEAKEGVDYTIVSGSLKDGTIVIKPINQVVIAGNYNNTITDPLETSEKPGKPVSSSKTGSDLSVMYIALVLLAASAVVFGAKRQLSK